MTSLPEPPVGPTADAPESRPPATAKAARFVQSAASALLITLTVVLVPVSLVAVWLHDFVLDTDRYVATMAPLATNPAVQDAAVDRITKAVNVKVDGQKVASDVADWLRKQGLPSDVGTAVKALGPTLDALANEAVSKAATRVVHSEAFSKAWTDANRVAHDAVVEALTGEGRGAVGVHGGMVTLDLGQAVDTLKQDLLDSGIAPAATIPDVDKQLVIFKSGELGQARLAARLLDALGNWLPPITAVLGGAGVLLARRRRRALVTVSLCAAGACVLMTIGLDVARTIYLDELSNEAVSDAAAAAIFDTVLRFLRSSVRTALVLGVAVALGAYLSGPGRLPRRLRAAADRAADLAARKGEAHGIDAGTVGVWVNRYRRRLAITVLLVLGLVFALWNNPTATTVIVLVVILVAAIGALALLAAGGRVHTRTTNRAATRPPTTDGTDAAP